MSRLVFLLQLFADLFVPLHHVRIRHCWERIPRDFLGEVAAISIRNIPLPDCILKVSGMLIRTEQDLNGLPPDEAKRQQGWDRRWFERITGGLKGVKAA
jgi:hypothetical protein